MWCAEVHGVGLEPLDVVLLPHHFEDEVEILWSIGAEATHVLDADQLGLQRQDGEYCELGETETRIVRFAVGIGVAADLARDADAHRVHSIAVARDLESVRFGFQVLLEYNCVGEQEFQLFARVRAHIYEENNSIVGGECCERVASYAGTQHRQSGFDFWDGQASEVATHEGVLLRRVVEIRRTARVGDELAQQGAE